MTRPRNTRDEIIPIPAVHGVHIPGAIEAQEAAGGAAMAAGDCEVIPVEILGGTDADLIALGFTLGEIDRSDPLFRQATLPPGWKRQGTGHSMHTDIVDELGRRRVGVFYKAAWYDRKAHLSITTVYGYVSSCVYEGTTPVLDETWATRKTVLAELDKICEHEQERVNLWSGQPEPYAAEYEQKARDKVTRTDALRKTLGRSE
ncbi:hypothetical protein FHS43_006228 [Streptosporangium becharense]|uniref:Uncharacterized protein n=1 Tax=Streptosporangium becharense TaxID=1816182 RepID=A0A7W9MHB2_9ACTN|nr:hypothetical protein [Streptosporangium becharense]MBB2914916.1 hypothetical protein [Streptosporangium becharense]MBB5820273.1 hypothetical protein [Streptosporangium becharense]